MLWFLLYLITLTYANDYNVKFVSLPSKPHYQHTTDDSLLVWPWRSYKTSHHTPPHMKIQHFKGPKLADGYIFISPVNSNNEDGTYGMSGTGYIFDHDGDLVFAAEDPSMGFCKNWIAGITDWRAQEYNGKRYITYWNGCNHHGHWGHRWGRVSFIDEEYSNFTINPDLGINVFDNAPIGQIGNHEHEMTDRNTMLVTSYNNTKHSLKSIDGPEDAWVADGMFFEIDIETQEVLYEWRGLEHLNMSDSRFGYKVNGTGVTERAAWDWLHINSVQRVGDNYLISARHHWAIYLINGTDGSKIWKLDGIDGGDFGSIPETFRWQHHARAHNVSDAGMTVSLFNNMVNGPKKEKYQTQGLAFWLPMPANPKHPPVLVKRLQTPSEMLFSGTQGSYQMDLGNGEGFGKGNGLIGYGLAPYIREYGPADDGSQLLWQAQFGEQKAVMCYRSFKMNWQGTPKHWDPTVVIENPRGIEPYVYMSWNGATGIEGWAVFAGNSSTTLASVGIAIKKGFETVLTLENQTCVQVGAIRNQRIIRMSNVACLGHTSTQSHQLSDDEYYGSLAYSETNYYEPGAVKQQIQAEKERLRKEMDKLESETWMAYRLFAKVALVVILLVAGAWVYVLWRDWRRRQQYATVPDNELGPLGLGLGLPRWQSSRRKQTSSERNADAAVEFDERRLDDLTPIDEEEKDFDAGYFGLAEDDEDETTSRRPYIRQLTS